MNEVSGRRDALLNYFWIYLIVAEAKYEISFEPSHEIMVVFVLRKLILQTRMRSHRAGLGVRFLVGPFVNFHTLCVRIAKLWGDCADAQARLSLRWSSMWSHELAHLDLLHLWALSKFGQTRRRVLNLNDISHESNVVQSVCLFYDNGIYL